VLLVDACRNDPQSDNSRARSLVRLESVTRPQQARPPGGVAALFSCSEGEKSFEHVRLKHGVFYHFVIRGLRGEADLNRDGTVGVEELALFTKSNVPEFVKEEYGFDVRQMPVLRGELGGLAALVGQVRVRENVPAPGPSRTEADGKLMVSRGSTSLKTPAPGPARGVETIANSVGMTLARIPAGEFLMGSPDSDKDAVPHEKPQHPVKISRLFYLGVHEVTQGQFKQVMGANPSRFTGSDDLPVDQATWYEAIDFCNALSVKEKRPPYYRVTPSKGGEPSVEIAGGTGYRLPAEAEWEYACRAGSTGRYFFGDDESVLATRAWSGVNSGNKTHPVGQMPANAFGLHDMHGNLWEWCWDWYDEHAHANARTDNPTGPASGVARVARGGSWWNDPKALRSANRWAYGPSGRLRQFGFRVARDFE
jgi:formylglycine-generating enzyme required for sulfatase activity